MKKTLVGFIGQGWVGKNYADDFERRGFRVVRYGLESEYVGNKDQIKDCDVVFIAVPTPTTSQGFDYSAVKKVISLVGKGKIAVIKSTILPGTTELIQKANSHCLALNSPEFLSEATAKYEAGNPFANIVGMPRKSKRYEVAAKKVHAVLPKAPFSLTCKSQEAELIKYAHNGSGYVQIIFFNLLYDLAKKIGADWAPIESAIEADPYVPNRYAKPVHKSGRGAGGHCFIKDFAALNKFYKKHVSDSKGRAVFRSLEQKNIDLLKSTNKDLDLLKGVYGAKI